MDHGQISLSLVEADLGAMPKGQHFQPEACVLLDRHAASVLERNGTLAAQSGRKNNVGRQGAINHAIAKRPPRDQPATSAKDGHGRHRQRRPKPSRRRSTPAPVETALDFGPLLGAWSVSYTHLRAHETRHDLV